MKTKLQLKYMCQKNVNKIEHNFEDNHADPHQGKKRKI